MIPYGVTIQMKPLWWNFCIVQLISFFKIFQLTFPLTHKISEKVKSDTSNSGSRITVSRRLFI